ncbi:MAG: histidine--tRNA ligase [Bacteroidetes bacterium]|nr:MAG: histidine--tRNA ligase [Bacteroidota bacterium]
MSIAKPTKPKGTRDFGPKQMARRNYLLNTIKSTFTKFGFLPLETPAMENLSVLTGKYGDEGDQLLFKILNSGDFLPKLKQELNSYNSKSITPEIAAKGLRYDLTVPFARYIVMNRNDINLPFRRYQIQPVWRADRPQKGRYREFLQCDADIVGTKSLLCEAEIIMMLNEIFTNLNLEGFEIAINSRKFLTGLSEYLGQPNKENQLCVAIDKLDKIGQEKVYEELENQGFDKDALNKLTPILAINGNNEEKLTALYEIFGETESAKAGLDELAETLSLVKGMSGDLATVNFDPSLARGLSYYTGVIFEVRMLDGSMGSISGGGRYDDLTGVFGMPDIPGTGFSLGIDRIYDVLESRSLFPDDLLQNTKVLIINFGEENQEFALKAISQLRDSNISSEFYPDNAKMKKQMGYADKNNIPFVVIAGSKEIEDNKVTVKNMLSGEQNTYSINELLTIISQELN